jgi:proton-translocating NADH-quinone oxidoreductase chain N
MPTLFLILPFLGIVFLNLFYTEKLKRIAFYLSSTIAIIQMILAAAVIFQIFSGVLSKIEINYFINFSIDFYCALVLFTIGLISFITLLVRKYSSSAEIFNFSNLILIIIIGMNGTVMVTDIFSLYVFLEVTAAVSFILIAKSKELPSLDGSFKYFLMSGIATILILSGIGMLYMSTSSLSYSGIASSLAAIPSMPLQLVIAFVFLIAGLSIKAGLVPFHMWVPEAYSSASASVSVLLAGIITKAGGIYAILRLTKDVFINVPAVQDVFAFLAIITIVVGALMALGQNDFKRMLAYSSISQVGYIIIGAACGTPLGFLGAFLHFFNHATFKSLLFVNSTAVEMQTGTRNLNKLQGLAAKMKITGGTSIVGFLSTAGIPPLSGFWSKIIIIIALWQVGFKSYAVIAILASVLTLAYFLILQRKVFFGNISAELENTKEANIGITTSAIILAIITVLVGIGFPFVLSFLKLQGLL